MDDKKHYDSKDIIDQDLYEDLDPETMLELINEERKKTREAKKKNETQQKPSFPRWIAWLLAGALFLNVIAFFPQTFSIPALDFLYTSAKLSADADIQNYKKSVVVIETQNSKGTGFTITDDGYIITNHHVVSDESEVTVAFPEHGLFKGEVILTDERVDLALLKVEENDLPYLDLADSSAHIEQQKIVFIGNPLRFNGIANEGVVIGVSDQTRLETEVVMLDAPVYRGNSGSPVLNAEGDVVAVIYATLNHSEYGKIGLAVPVEHIHKIK